MRREKEVEWGERRDKLTGYNWNEKKESFKKLKICLRKVFDWKQVKTQFLMSKN